MQTVGNQAEAKNPQRRKTGRGNSGKHEESWKCVRSCERLKIKRPVCRKHFETANSYNSEKPETEDIFSKWRMFDSWSNQETLEKSPMIGGKSGCSIIEKKATDAAYYVEQ
jgi:hypothetical protein